MILGPAENKRAFISDRKLFSGQRAFTSLLGGKISWRWTRRQLPVVVDQGSLKFSTMRWMQREKQGENLSFHSAPAQAGKLPLVPAGSQGDTGWTQLEQCMLHPHCVQVCLSNSSEPVKSSSFLLGSNKKKVVRNACLCSALQNLSFALLLQVR